MFRFKVRHLGVASTTERLGGSPSVGGKGLSYLIFITSPWLADGSHGNGTPCFDLD